MPRLVVLMRHSVRMGSTSFDDPLNSVAGAQGAETAADALLWGVLLQQQAAVAKRKPFMVITSPLERCIDTSLHVLHKLQDAGFDVRGYRIANCLAEETYNLLRHVATNRPQKTIADLLPMHEVLRRTADRNLITGNLGLDYVHNPNAAGQPNYRIHDLLPLHDTNHQGVCQRMLNCVDWCMAKYPDYN